MDCPICENSQATIVEDSSAVDAVFLNCPRCGKFGLTRTLEVILPNVLTTSDTRAKLSHVLRKAHEAGKALILDSYTAEAIIKKPLPRPREQADLLIAWLAVTSPGPGESIELKSEHHCSVVGAKSNAGFALLLEHLKSRNYVTGHIQKYLSGEVVANLALTFEGWDYYETLRLGGTTYRKAFMAMKFNDETLNTLLENVLKPSAKRAGFDLFKLDDRPKAGLIDDRMRVEIRASDFVVADLTHDNLGAYWEAGFAEGLGKPVIYTCKRSKFEEAKTHFDTNHHLTIVWDSDSAESAGIQLTETIRATLPHLAKLTDD